VIRFRPDISSFKVDSDDEIEYTEYYEEIDEPESDPSKSISTRATKYGLQRPVEKPETNQEGALAPPPPKEQEEEKEEEVEEEEGDDLLFAHFAQRNWEELSSVHLEPPIRASNENVNLKEWDNDKVFNGSMHLGDKPFDSDEKDMQRSTSEIMSELFANSSYSRGFQGAPDIMRQQQQQNLMMRMRAGLMAGAGVSGMGLPMAVRGLPSFQAGRGGLLASPATGAGVPLMMKAANPFGMVQRPGLGIVATRDIRYSRFLHPNRSLQSGSWVDDIAWDDDSKDNLSTNLILDLNDPHMLLERSEEEVEEEEEDEDAVLVIEDEAKEKIRATRGAKLRTMLTAHDIAVKRQKEEAKNIDKFNLSNDVAYIPKASAHADSDIAHSLPGEKWAARKPHPSQFELRNFHRPRKNFPGEVFRIRAPRKRKRLFTHNDIIRHYKDLSAKDGRVILVEFTEEFPPILTNMGMGGKIRNYYRKVNAEDNQSLVFTDGESIYLHPDSNEDRSPFIADIPGGIAVQCMDTNLYKQPIFQHQPKNSDFLLLRSSKAPHKLVIREIPGLYTGGQIFPLKEVPHPGDRVYVFLGE
jgi:hypothetical protein